MIREFEIRNDKFKVVEGILRYNTDTKEFSMTLPETYNGKTVDTFFYKLVNEQHITEVPQHFVRMWLKRRVIPPERQGLQGILKDLGLKEYDVFELLLLGCGRCDMDSSYIKEIVH